MGWLLARCGDHRDTHLSERALPPALEKPPENRVGAMKTGLIETPAAQGPEGGCSRICGIHQRLDGSLLNKDGIRLHVFSVGVGSNFSLMI